MEIQYLKDDLDYLIEVFQPTANQEREYPKIDGKRIAREMLGRDHPKALRLLREDGGDGEAVCAVDAGSAINFWEYGTKSHIFFTTLDLVRLSAFFRLDFYRSLALVLKGCWEQFFAKKMGWPDKETALEEMILDLEAVKQYKTEFQPDCGEIFECLERHGERVSQAGYDRERFSSLVQEMILNDLHLAPTNNEELKTFAAAKTLEHRMVLESEEKLQEEFWTKKQKWIELQSELEEQLMLLEKRRLQNANILHQWLNIFGEVYVDLEEQIWRLRMLERRIQILEENPNLTEEQLEEKVMQVEAEEQRKLEELRYQLALAPWLQRPTATGAISEQDLLEYHQKCKQVLRKLWMLLYPERLERHPAYHKLTEQQKQQLKELWYKIPQIKPDELGYHTNQVGYGTRSLEKLMEALATAESILAHAGLNINVNLVIQGNTLQEKIEWLKNEVENLKRDIYSVKAEIRALNKDKDTLEKHNILVYPEKYEETRGRIKERADEYRRQADQLEQIFEQLLRTRKFSDA